MTLLKKKKTTMGSDILNPFPFGALQPCLGLKLCKVAFSLIFILHQMNGIVIYSNALSLLWGIGKQK